MVMTKILVVDDHDAMRHALRDWLANSLPNCRFFEATTREQAIAVCQKETIEIVLMDYGLATINGIEVTRRIKLDMPEINIVMISIHEDQRYQIEATNAGVSHDIPKRTMPRELIAAQNELLHKPSRPKQPPSN